MAKSLVSCFFSTHGVVVVVSLMNSLMLSHYLMNFILSICIIE